MNSQNNIERMEDRLDSIVAQLAAGDKLALAAWCDYFRDEVNRRARAFANWVGGSVSANVREDLRSEGMVAVLEAAHRVISETDKDWFKYAKGHTCWHIKWQMYDFLLNELVGSSKQAKTLRRKMQQGEEVPEIRPVTETDAAESNQDVETLDLWDEVEACCTTDEEKQIMRALSERRTVCEAANLVGVHYSTVVRYRHQVWERFKRRNAL